MATVAAATAAASAAASAAEARIQRQFVELQYARLRDLDTLQERLRREFDTLKIANAAKSKQLAEVTMELSQVSRIASERESSDSRPPTATASLTTAKHPPAAPGTGTASPGKGSRSQSATAISRKSIGNARSKSPRAKTPGPDRDTAAGGVFAAPSTISTLAAGSAVGGAFGASTLGASPAVLARMEIVRARTSEADDECMVSHHDDN